MSQDKHPGRPRQPEVDTRLSEAVLALLRSGGPGAVTVEAVAARSGVAKTTIYRRHANRADLLRATLTDAVGTPEAAASAIETARRARRGTVLLLVKRGNNPPAYVGVELNRPAAAPGR